MGKKVSIVSVLITVMFFSTALQAAPSMDDTSGKGVIELISKEETNVPGYFHQKYVFWHESCPAGQPVDYYGPAFDPNDPNRLMEELRLCQEIPDGGSTDSSDDS